MNANRGIKIVLEFFLSTLFILTTSPNTFGLSPDLALTQFVHEQWQTDKGLPDNTIRDIAQTPDGYLWLATESGLVRFDGLNFKLFDRGNVSELKDSYIEKLAVTLDGNLWIGSRSGGLICYHQRQFARVPLGAADPQNITALYASPDGMLWVGSRNNRFYSVRKNRISEYRIPSGEGDYPIAFFKDSHDSLWVGTAFGRVACLDEGHLTICNESPLPFCKGVCGFVEDPKGSLWVGTDGQGLFEFQSGEYVPRTFSPDRSGQNLQALLVDQDNTIWAGTQDIGLVRYAHGKFDNLFPQDTESFRHVLCIFEDREASLWFGTYSRGLHRLRKGAFKSLGKAEGFMPESIGSIYQDHHNRLWVSTLDRGLGLLDNGQLRMCANNNLPTAKATAIHEFPSGEMCIGTSRYGIMRATDPFSGDWQRVPGIEGEILSICEDTFHRLWIGTSANGLHCLDGTNHIVFTTENGLPSNSIRVVINDRKGGLWLGTQNSGLSHFANGVFTNYGTDEGLSDTAVRALLLDSTGVLWMGTRAGGLNCLSAGHIRVLRKENGLFQNTIYSLLDDEQGNIWFGTPNGIGRLAHEEIERFLHEETSSVSPMIFSELDGIRNPECSSRCNPSACKTRSGELWFGTTRGLVIVNPNELAPRQKGPTVLVEDVSADDRIVDRDDGSHLASGTARLQFSYSAPAFLNASRVRFEHKLDGFDTDWVEAGNRREAVYTRLGPGHYLFNVRARNDNSDWTLVPGTFAFTILTPFYQTLPFYLGVAIASLLMIRVTHLLRARQSHRRERILQQNVQLKTRQLLEEIMTRRKAEEALRELPQRIMHAQEGERRRVARELHDGVNQMLASIRLRLFKLEGNLSHDQKEEARRASKLLEMARTEVTRISQNLRPSELDDLGLVPAFRSAIEQLTNRNQMKVDFAHEHLPEQIPDQIQDNLYRIMQEALTNIEKHSGATEVQVRLEFVDGAICLIIADNGKGFTASEQRQAKAAGNGWGLLNMRERATSQEGDFSVDSAPACGTKISVRLPLPIVDSNKSAKAYAQP